jgi:hypothetical protein
LAQKEEEDGQLEGNDAQPDKCFLIRSCVSKVRFAKCVTKNVFGFNQILNFLTWLRAEMKIHFPCAR